MFMHEFSEFLELVSCTPGYLMITGDFNFHVENSLDREANLFMDILHSAHMKQHVTGPTHIAGGTLDLIITRESEEIVSKFDSTGYLPSDHAAIMCSLHIGKPDPVKMEIEMRKARDINMESFRTDILSSPLYTSPATDIDSLIEQYDSVLSNLFDKHAPIITRSITCRPHAPWFTDEIHKVKQEVRRCERRWLSSKLEIHKQIFKERSSHYHHLIKQSKRNYHKLQLEDCDSRQLFKKIDNLCTPKSAKTLPSNSSDVPLVEQFSHFFADKIKRISNYLRENHRVNSLFKYVRAPMPTFMNLHHCRRILSQRSF